MASDSEDERFDEEEQEDEEITNPSVLTKYKDAGEISSRIFFKNVLMRAF